MEDGRKERGRRRRAETVSGEMQEEGRGCEELESRVKARKVATRVGVVCAVKTPVSFRDGRFFDGTHRERFEIYREGRLKADAGARSFNTQTHGRSLNTHTHTNTRHNT